MQVRNDPWLRSAEQRAKSGLRNIVWFPTSRCNLSCIHCCAARFLDKGELDENGATRMFREAAEAGTKHIVFCGGEPLLRQDALDLVRLADELGIRCTIASNGSTYTEEALTELAKCNASTIVSIDGANRETHEKIRGKGSWDFVLKAVERMRRVGNRIFVEMAVNKINYREVADYLAMVQDWGATRACLKPVIPTGRATTEMLLDPKEMLGVIQTADKVTERLQLPTSLQCVPFAKLITRSRYLISQSCRAEQDEMSITPTGDAVLCHMLDIAVANICENGLGPAWEKQNAAPLMQTLQDPAQASLCPDCSLNEECRGGCYARGYFLKGDFQVPDPLCPRVAGIC
ncbi:MAG: radical SAM protein [Dehalococcoidales bacterium]|nr:radical SAM protein [Dehalococcoidales bacterium]